MTQLAIWREVFLFSAFAYLPLHFLLFSVLRRLPVCSSSIPVDLSVLIPVRDEAIHLEPHLKAVLEQEPPPAEVIVVDDMSSDGSAELARSCFKRFAHENTECSLLESGGPPRGWTGKNWACKCGADHARGRYLLFLDADVDLSAASYLFPRLCEAYRREPGGALISVQPYHRIKRGYELFSLFFHFLAIAGAKDFGIYSRRRRPASAFGPLLFTSRDVYQSCGGHAAIRGDVVDDQALCALFLDRGYSVRSYLGEPSLSFRMYPHGFGQLLEGWTKNMATGAARAGFSLSVLLFFWITGMVNAFLGLCAAIGSSLSLLSISAVLAYLLWSLVLYCSARRVISLRFFPVLCYPLYLAGFLFIFFRSIYMTRVLGRVSWRGRNILIEREENDSR